MIAPITIENYNVLWPERFESLHSRIAAVLDGLASAIEHVGSTAVPGLAAKPIIDIDVLLRSAADLPLAIMRLAAQGYEHRGDLGMPGREAFQAVDNVFSHHLYVCLPDCSEYYRHLAFRDYLRAHPEDACAYANLKRMLASQSATDREAYTQAKTAFVQEILRRTGMTL